jgi:hypothetical protein
VVVTHLALYRALSGGLDATSLNGRRFFTRNVLLASVTAYALGALWHRARGGRWDALVPRAEALLVATLGGNAAHVAAYGWTLGYPLPGPYLYFAPFLLTTFLITAGLALTAFALLARGVRGSAPTEG